MVATPRTAYPRLVDLAPETIGALRGRGVVKRWTPGTVLFREQTPADTVLLIETGTVKIVTTTAGGTERVLALRTSGDLVGELAAVDGGLRSATAIAASGVTGSVISAGSFRQVMAAYPAAAMGLLAIVVARLRAADRQRAEFGSADTTVRLAHAVAELAGSHGTPAADGVAVTLLSQDELAAVCGASREGISRGLRRLRAAGLLSTGRRTLVVHDVRRLREWSR